MTDSQRLVFVLLVLSFPRFTQGQEPSHNYWQPMVDEVYLQEVGRQVETASPVLAVCYHEGTLYASCGGRLSRLEGDSLVESVFPGGPVDRLYDVQGSVWAISQDGLFRLESGAWKRLSEARAFDLCLHLGKAVVATGDGLMTVDGDRLSPMAEGKSVPGFQNIESYSETLYCLSQGGLAVFDGKEFDWENVVDWGVLPSNEARDLLAQGSRLYIAADRGLGVLRGMSLTVLTGKDGLCYEDTTCLEEGFDGDLWIGTTRGAIRHIDGEFQYFGAERWIPGERVYDIACDENTVVIATDKGLGIIEYEPYTLQKKGAFYERHLEEWGQKRLGFVHQLEWNDALGEWIREVSDNDLGWSTHYLTAMCFKYAVTGDPTARAAAVDFFNSMKWSEEITPIDGFPARSIWAKGEKGHQAEGGSGGYAAEWHDTPDGVWEWKADTSSDEIDAHFYAASIFHDLAAQGDEKRRAEEHIGRIASHIVDNGWCLRDLDGKPTRWGRWEPEYLQTPIGYYARGLNGLEVLNFMKTAYALTGDSKFEAAYRKLQDMGYHKEIIRQKLTFPPPFVFHSDDRLAFYSYYPLLRYETDPYLRSVYRRSLERSWEIERIEHNPWFNFIYGALTGSDCEMGQAVRHLREWPLDLVDHRHVNSHRHDLQTPSGYVPYSGGIRAFSPREIGPHRWSSTSLSPDGGGGRIVVDPSGWLDAYWMGRNYGSIEAPKIADPELLSVPQRGFQLGAEPYKGPARP